MQFGMNLKKRMRTVFAALCLMLLAAVTGMSFAAISAQAEQLAAPELQIYGSIDPSVLAAPGEVTMNLTLTNLSDGDMRNLTLSTPDGQATLLSESISAEETQILSCVYPVSLTELDSGTISCIVVCETDGGRFSYPLNIAILREHIEPQVEFLRQISSTEVLSGNTATLVYHIHNTGNVAINSITVTDVLGEFTGEVESLAVGESASLVQRVTVTEDVISSPTLEYSVGSESENVYTARLDDAVIRAAHSLLDATITAGRSIFSTDMSEVILTLTNNGGMDYHNIAVFDDLYGGIIAEGMTLPAGGDSLEIAHSYPLRESSLYRWRVTGNTAAGDHIDFVTEEVEVSADDTGDVLLVLNASVSKPRINRKGYVTFTLELTNVGTGFASQVQVSETSEGEITELAVVPAGDPTVVTVRYEIRESSEFVFSASYLDQNGQLRTATSEPVLVEIVVGGEKPEERDAAPVAAENPLVRSQLFLGLLIGSCVLLVTLLVALIIASLRERKERKERDAARKQKLREELGKTNRFTPIKQTINKKK